MRKIHPFLPAGLLTIACFLFAGNQASAKAGMAAGQSNSFLATLSAFDYIPVNAHTVTFTWTTSQEVNVEKIELQAGSDSLNFITLDVQNAFNFKYGHTYYTPEINIDQYKYYRLRIVNESGAEDYSTIIHLTNASLTKQNITLFPNPVVGLAFNIKVPTPNRIGVMVYSKEGLLLYATSLQGQFEYRINLPASANGIMNLVVQVSENNSTQTFSVLNK